MTVKFSYGIINTSGKLRILHLHDGWYVTGKGMLVPVQDERAARKMLAEMKPKDEPRH